MGTSYSKGILFGLVACFFYALMDMLAKYSLSVLKIPYPIYYVSVNILILLIIIPYIIYNLLVHKIALWRFETSLILLVAVFSMSSFALSFFSLSKIPLDVFYSILFTTPIITTFVAIFFLKEEFTKRKLIAILIGFLGILFITNPLTIFKYKISIIGVFAAFAVTILDSIIALSNRRFLNKEHPLTIRLYLFIFASFAGIIANYNNKELTSFYTTNFHSIILIVATSISMLTASLCYTKAYQNTPSSLVSTTYYSFIIWGVLFGYLVFHDIPNVYTIIGCTMIIIANMYLYLPVYLKNKTVK